EPCGLNQLYALRYGTVPVVHQTGGLADTVRDVHEKDGYGICFNELSPAGIVKAVGRALDMYKDKGLMNRLKVQIMSLDFSWNRSAREYIDLYKNLIKPHEL